MGEFMFGIVYVRPSKRQAKACDRICKEEGGDGYHEVNRTPDTTPGINNGRYQGWFCAPNRGEPFESQLAARVFARIKENS